MRTPRNNGSERPDDAGAHRETPRNATGPPRTRHEERKRTLQTSVSVKPRGRGWKPRIRVANAVIVLQGRRKGVPGFVKRFPTRGYTSVYFFDTTRLAVFPPRPFLALSKRSITAATMIGNPTVASTKTSPNFPPSEGGTNLPQEMASLYGLPERPPQYTGSGQIRSP